MQEFYIAHQRATEGNPSFLIPILLEDIQLNELPRDLQTYLRTYTYIDVSDYDTDTLRKKIRFAMPNTPFKVLLEKRKAKNDNDDGLIEGELLENIGQDVEQQGDEQNIERVDAIGGILRLLQGDGSIFEVAYPKELQCDSDDSDEN